MQVTNLKIEDPIRKANALLKLYLNESYERDRVHQINPEEETMILQIVQQLIDSVVD